MADKNARILEDQTVEATGSTGESKAPKAKRVVNRGPRVTRMIVTVDDDKKVTLEGVYAQADAHKLMDDYDRLIQEGKNPQRIQHTAEK